jgi:hypothetical protein
LVLGFSGCGDDEDKNLVVIGVSATPALLNPGDVAVVEALVTNRTGTPQDDETVFFSVVPAGAGSFSFPSVSTNGVGIASVTFTASSPGTALIGARVGNNPSIEYGTIVIESEDGGGGGGNSGQLVVTVSPSFMNADGQSTATIAAEVTDNLGNPIANLTPVKFTAGEKFTDVNGDGLWTENVDELEFDIDGDGEWDALGLIAPAIDYTDGGMASATFTAGLVPGLVHIKVTVGNAEDEISDDVTLSLTSINPIASIALTPEWQQIQVRGTGGIEWAQITAETFDEHGNPAAPGQPLEFSILSGPGGGEKIGGDAVGPVSVLTDALGKATMTLNAGTLPGTVRVRARSGSVLSTATQVTIRSGPPALISLGAAQCNVPSWELVGYDNEIIAVVVDEWGNEVPDSTSVYFGTEQGLIEGAAETQVALTVRGKAVTYWNSGAPKDDQFVYYWCETGGGTVRDTAHFLESGPPRLGSFLEAPTSLPADGESEQVVIVEVLDLHEAFVVDGTPVDMYSAFGTINSGATSDGCHSSTFLTFFRSQVLREDYSYTIPDDGIGVVTTITARSGGTSGFHAEHQVTLTTGPSASKSSVLEAPGSVPAGFAVPIEVVIKDYNGNPLGGHLIELSASAGTVTDSVQYTNKYGIASGFLFTAQGEQGDQIILTATDLDPGFGGLVLWKLVTISE